MPSSQEKKNAKPMFMAKKNYSKEKKHVSFTMYESN